MSVPLLYLTSELTRDGRAAALQAWARAGTVVPVCRGVWADRAMWDAAYPDARARARARAHHAMCADAPVFAFSTAAALHGLPLYGREDPRAHVLDPDAHPARSRPGVFRHSGPLPTSDVVSIGGLRVTSLERTVVDVIRTGSLQLAVSVFDAALRRVAWRRFGDYDHAAAADFRAEVVARLERMPGARGIRQARFLTGFADGRAQLPGESVSRLWMHLLGVPAPELQLAISLPQGGRAYLDFAWPELCRFGEFDGDGKYVDPELTAGRSVRDVPDAFARFLRSQRLLS